jgi:hypothetical protein
LIEEDKEWAKLILPRLMEALCNMDDETRSSGCNTTFIMGQVYEEPGLRSVSRETFTTTAKLV